jgi:hypothetical protein
VAACLTLATKCEFSFAFATLLGGFLACGGLGLWWLTLWARQKDGRLGQFGIGSLLFLTVFAAMFFGTVRWIVVQISLPSHQADNAELFSKVALISLIVGLCSIPWVLRMSEALLWAAVWFVKFRRWVREQEKSDDRS